ncbi:MAG: serine/threonine-protein kinase [Bdellovibrionota bacterium]
MESTFQPLGVGVGTLINNRYELVRKLGSGAMSAVYQVADRALNNDTIALKLFSPGINANATLVERIHTEVLITRKLNAVNIVRSYDFGKTREGLYFMTMEYISGVTLDRLIHAGPDERPRFSELIKILRDIAIGISQAHKQGVIHRDLKPANIIISDDGVVKIADFGLARALDISKDLTQVGECVGTPFYMAPEQIQLQELDGRTDIYALGVIAYELATGIVPFNDVSWYNLASQIISQPLPEIDRNARIPGWFNGFVKKAAAKKPDDRFQSADEVAEFLQSKLDANDVMGTGTESRLPKVLSRFGRGITASAPARTRRGAVPPISATKLLVGALVLFSFLLLYLLNQPAAGNLPQNLNQGAQAVNGMVDTMNKMTEFVQFMVQNKQAIDQLSKDLQAQNDGKKVPPVDITPKPPEAGSKPSKKKQPQVDEPPASR